MPSDTNPFSARKTLSTASGEFTYYDIGALSKQGVGNVDRLPYSMRVLLEALLRNVDGFVVSEDDVRALANWNAKAPAQTEVPFMPGRVVLQDFTGVPAVVDLAAMRSAMQRLGGDPDEVNPQVRCDLVIDHSVQVDAYGSATALTINADKEFDRNRERYEFLKWGQQAFDNFSVVPPATGIVHQVNLEYLASCVLTKTTDAGDNVAYPDSLVGTDSHTTMINGLGVVGWGVGGIEAEACMLGQPIYMLTPEVVGFRLTGQLPEGATATDLVLTVTQMLRAHGVVGKFVEFFGPSVARMSIPDRATIANMAPEYGATMGFFPVDARTLEYLRLTARDDSTIELVEKYCKANHLFWTPDAPEPSFTDVLELDMSTVKPSLAGPKRPQDRIELGAMKPQWRKDLVDTFGKKAPSECVRFDTWAGEGGAAGHAHVNQSTGAGPCAKEQGWPVVNYKDRQFTLHHGDVVIAAITSCTNTSNPDVMIAAGLVAKKANELGLKAKPWVKTSLAPGSKVVTDYYEAAGLDKHLDALGFQTVGYGCTTCIGNSGPLPDPIEAAIKEGDLVATSVLSGNRNFEGRISPFVKANYLASPPLVVAYAIAGTVDIDMVNDPIGQTEDGKDVYLKDLWPTHEEVVRTREASINPGQFTEEYGRVYDGNTTWNAVASSTGSIYEWKGESTYVQEPPFFEELDEITGDAPPITGARCLVSVGDSVTTDHISPAGSIPADGPAGKYLTEHGVPVSMFNSFGSRRGNDRVMTRGTFANVRVRNKLAPGTEGGWTTDFTDGKVKSIYEASLNYKKKNIPLVVLAGVDYGMGSSRDWAAKGTYLLGVRAVIAVSYERIHRSNLVGMGVLPLQFKDGQSRDSLGLDGTETFDVMIPAPLKARCEVPVKAKHPSGKVTEFNTLCRIDTPVEVDYYRNGGILHTVLRRMVNDARQGAAV
ncbi:MAG: aconitate hydratase AcnA [Phycisphaeraceae bacterium]|nr:aconitate hydratase AcnA [Phycisphaeraceae bacterium]MCB9847753.1 aconitate hydratase AcnA [Phycisphaeraceae bacterium]